MNNIIDAGAAKLAGLQIDLLQKVRQGHATIEHLEWFNGLSRAQRDMLSGADLTTLELPKFALLVDLGIITVPANYDHSTWLARFEKKHQGGKVKSFDFYNDLITDENFPKPSRILKPGDRLHVQAFQHVVPGTTTSKERMDFLRGQPGNQFTGAQGASIACEQKRDQLPKGKWYASFDEEERLLLAGGCHRVPFVNAGSYGVFYFGLGNLEHVWDVNDAFFSFRDLSLVA